MSILMIAETVNAYKLSEKLWKNQSWILHQDNAPALNALSLKRYLAIKGTSVLEHVPYSPDLAPCGSFFSKDQVCLKRNLV